MIDKLEVDAVLDHTKTLSDFIANTRFEDLPKEIVEKAKLIITDTIGVAIAGSVEPEMKKLYDLLPEGNDAVLFKEGIPKTSLSMAGIANAIAICLVELDEGTPPSGHPALHVLPPVFAFAQQQGKSGSELLTAFILGYEVHYRLQKAAKLRKSVNPHGNTGHVGAVAAIGKLMNWNAEQIRQGMNCAAALPLGTSFEPCLAGSTIASAFPALSAPIAFMVKDLIESGFTGYDLSFSDSFGNVIGEKFNPAVLTENLGIEFGVMNNYFKYHANCAVVHPVLDAIAEALGFHLDRNKYPPIRLKRTLHPDEIREISVKGTKRTLRLMFLAENNSLSAKFSLPYAAAVYVLTGEMGIDSFSQERLTDTNVRNVEKLVKLELDPDLQEINTNNPNIMPAKVRIILKNGEVLEGESTYPYGTAKNPSTQSNVYAKFKAITKRVLENRTQERIWDTILQLDKETDLSEIFSCELTK